MSQFFSCRLAMTALLKSSQQIIKFDDPSPDRSVTVQSCHATCSHVSTLRQVRRIAQSLVGIDLARFPGCHPLAHVATALCHHHVQVVVDIGANDGGYADDLRRLGYRGRIVSFEPVSHARKKAQQRAAKDPGWTVVPAALGAEEARVKINIAANGAASSSVLEMLPRHEQAAPDALIIGHEMVNQYRLDDVWAEFVGATQPAYVKLDVQGYERSVLDGAEKVLENRLITGLQMEMSFVPLYAGAWLHDEALTWAKEHGFMLDRIVPGFSDPDSGRMLQADGVFFRA